MSADLRWTDLFGAGPVVVDGGLSTQLARLGEDTSGLLWTGRVLLDNPAAVTRAHADYASAGADVLISASYQVSRWGFEQAGLTAAEADDALRASTAAARAAADRCGRRVRVAASVGPYGAILHDGSEYRGDYGLTKSELVDFHRERLDVLAATRPDLLAVETIPDVREAEAIVDVLADHPDLPAWVSFSGIDDGHVCAGQPIEEAVLVAASAPSVVAVGINCTDPRFVLGLVRRIRAVSGLPIVVYPNAGGQWDADDGEWHGGTVPANEVAFPDRVVGLWVESGAVAVGGCCGTDAASISRIAGLLGRSGG
jgi:homocysteine S-methyltransferase